MKPSVLLVDDEPSILYGYSRYLKKSGYNLKQASSIAEARKILSFQGFEAVILDMVLPDGTCIDLISEIKDTYSSTAVVVATGKGDIRAAVDAMRQGADNFLTKPIDLEELDIFLQRCIELSALRKRDLNRQRLIKKFEPYFGESEAMKKVMGLAKVAAGNDSPVLILGKTGSGKGVLARWIHDNSSRGSLPIVDVNCSSLRGELLASELFGHVKGAFTSAIEDRQGLVDLADCGTLFLDEIGDMDLSVQAQFLKTIEEKTYRRLGESKIRHSDFTPICATNRDLKADAELGRFREDLYYRIHVFPIVIPSLSERPEDLPGLVRHILNSLDAPDVEITADIMKLLQTHPWPGNVRELKNMIERALLLASGEPFLPEHFPGLVQPVPPIPAAARNMVPLNKEHIRIRDALIKTNNDKRKAAELLGISLPTLYRKLKKFP
jgi:DNA-binding NtrC family response regulator